MKDLSRRRFLGALASGLTGMAALSTSAGAARGAVPPFLITQENYPWKAPGKREGADHFRMVALTDIPVQIQQKFLACSPGIEFLQCH